MGDFETIGGLSSRQVEERKAAGLVNAASSVRTKTIPRIVRDNVVTLFNAVNVALAAAIFLTGSYSNLLFMVIIVANVSIGIFQEIRAKIMVDRLSVITSTRARVVRDGRAAEISLDEIVMDDVLVLQRGDQVPSDCRVVDGKCSVNESLVTGESEIIPKPLGSSLLSGSYVVAGQCAAQVTAVGSDNYANHINDGVKVLKVTGSEIMRSLEKIVKYVSIALVPLGIVLFSKEALLSVHGDVTSAILHTSAALIGMIPQGLILLTSAVLAVSVYRLSQHRVLVQQIYCVETLARVDVVCLDKTGTLTTGEMEVDEVIPVSGASYEEALLGLRALMAAEGDAENETSHALRNYLANVSESDGSPAVVDGPVRVIPFSSERKYSGVCYGSDAGNYALGAVEFVMRGNERLAEIQDLVERYGGVRRMLVLARVDDFDEEESIIGDVSPLGLVCVKDVIRESASETLEFFKSQGVRVNVISGDSLSTVTKIARDAGVSDTEKGIDMSSVETPDALQRAARECRVFARVSPEQKKQLVEALRGQGHTVAMVGDGVNDVLALSVADCSIAMGSGSDATRSIAQVVLLDNDFSTLPSIVAEGRRSINNLQCVAVLYLTKTIYSIVLAVMYAVPFLYDFPFSPIQITVTSFFGIGLPSLVLGLEPSKMRIRGHFLRNVMTRAAPGAVAVIVANLALVAIGSSMGLSQGAFSTLCLVSVSAIALNVVVRQSLPATPLHVVLQLACALGFAVSYAGFGSFFGLEPLALAPSLWCFAVTVVVLVLFNVAYSIVIERQRRYLDALEAEQLRLRET